MSHAYPPARVTTWVIYDHPADYPRSFVARKWVGDDVSDEVLCANSVAALRSALEQKGLHRLPRHHTDSPMIVETWL